MTTPKAHLEAILASLEAQRHQIEAFPVATAPDFTWIDVYPSSGRNYARVRSDRPLFSGKKFMALGREGSPRHREYQQRIEKRNALAELERRSLAARELLEMFEQPIWEPPAPEPGLATDQAELGEDAEEAIALEVGTAITVPCGWRGYVTRIEGDRADIKLDNGIEDNYPLDLLEAIAAPMPCESVV